MPKKIKERHLECGEYDLGTRHASAEGFGRLTLRKHEDPDYYELFDLSTQIPVLISTDLERLVEDANLLVSLELYFEESLSTKIKKAAETS